MLLSFSFISSAQVEIDETNSISYYNIFSGQPSYENYSTSNATNFNSGAILSKFCSVNGNVGSHGLIYSQGRMTFNGALYSSGQIILGDQTHVNGDMSAARETAPYYTNRAIQCGEDFELEGNINAGADVYIEYDYYEYDQLTSTSTTGGSSVDGSVTLDEDYNYSGPTPSQGLFFGNPQLPELPELPEPMVFPAHGTQNITTSTAISPGAYKKIQLGGNSILTFNGPGIYTFEKIKNSGQTNQFKFDFQNNENGVFIIQVHGDVDLFRTKVILLNGGDPSRILLETHGTGSSQWGENFACIIKNGGESNNNSSSWKGTIYAPYGGIYAGRGNGFSTIEGALWSSIRVILNKNVSVFGSPFEYQECSPPIASAGPDMTLNCNNPTVVLDGSNSSEDLEYEWDTEDGNIASGADGLSPVVDQPGTYTLTVTDPETGCSATDVVEVNANFNPPDIYVSDDQYLACGDEGVFLFGASEFNNVTYEWTSPDGTFEETEGSDIFATSAGTFILTITRNGNGCSVSDTVQVFQDGGIQVYAGEDVAFGCTTEYVLLYGNVDGEYPYLSYDWSSPDGDFEYDDGPQVIRALSPGTYIFYASYEDGGCSSSDTVIVYPDFQGPGAYAGPDQVLECYDYSLELEGSSDHDEVSFSWSSEDGEFNNTDSANVIYALSAGTYVLTVTDLETGCFSIDSVVVTAGADGPIANAGPPKALSCYFREAILAGSVSNDNGAANLFWYTENGNIVSGEYSLNPLVNAVGTYYLYAFYGEGACESVDSTVVVQSPCILPVYPPIRKGKVNEKIGSELTSLYENYDQETDTINQIFRIINDSVYIEVITLEGFTQNVMDLIVQSPDYGMTDFIPNGLNPLIITGKYPINKLNNLNISPMSDLISYVRPVFPAVNSSGVALTQGDLAQHSDIARNGFGVDGTGVKVCVLSDSYNTVLGDPAQTDILNGDLPGIGSPSGSTPVHVIKEWPYGRLSDEGRAMLQIVHDVAPGAELGFRSGVISEGDLASGVIQSANEGCNILVDDISFLTSPFFQDGVVAQAVETVSAAGVSYFAAAGNFAGNSYESTFNETPSPEGFTGLAHDFGGGDVLQKISLLPGTYTIVLQWQDSIYSLGQTGTGTANDFDIYLTNELGTEYFGFNRNNLGGDPFEVLPFTVPGTEAVEANIMIVRAAGTQAADIKFMAFRGELDFLENPSGPSTIVGQANAESAITLGAVNYFNTPAYGVDPPEVTSFSSVGGTPVDGAARQKPDLLAPNGVNTTVFLGTPDTDGNGDLFPNFFGTSAAAPHAAAVGALLKQAKSDFYGLGMSPAELKGILTSTAYDINTPGFDVETGFGFLQADQAMLTLAAATPSLISLALEDSSIIPGTIPFTTIVTGNYFSTSSVIIVGEDTLSTVFINGSTLTGIVPEFLGNPPVYVYTPPVTPSGLDGGNSESLYFFGDVPRVVTITADDKSKLYGEALPTFTASILLEGVPLEDTPYTLESLGISALNFNTPATSTINSGIYFIAPEVEIADSSFLELFEYELVNGLLNIQKMPLTIIPLDTTIEYGDHIDGLSFEFDYEYDETNILSAEREAFEMSIKDDHLSTMTKAIGLIDDAVLIDDRGVIRDDFLNLAFMATQRAVVSAQSFITQRPVVSGFTYDTTRVVYVSPESLFEYQVDDANADLFAAGPLLNRQRAVVSQRPVVSGLAFITQRPVVSGSAIVNSSSSGDSGDSDIAIIFDEDDATAPENDTIFVFKSINVITGINVGSHYIASAALLTSNFELSLEVGDLIITQAPLTLTPVDMSVPFSSSLDFSYTAEGFKYEDSIGNVISADPLFTILDENDIVQDPNDLSVGVYTIRMEGAEQFSPENYSLIYEEGILIIEPNVITVTADEACILQYDTLSGLTSTITGYNGDLDDIVLSGPSYYISDGNGTEFYPINLQFNNVGLVPGQYLIYPENLELVNGSNYVVEYVPGMLYVNPRGNQAMDISIWVDCVDTLLVDSLGYEYVANFAYYNPNPITLCVPLGENNNVSSAAQFEGNPPHLFPPGYGSFALLFDYTDLTWNLNTYELFTLNQNYAVAGQNTITCIPVLKSSLTDSQIIFSAQPNPSSGLVTINAVEGETEIQGVRVIDLLGSVHDIPLIFGKKDSSRTLDFSSLDQGIYLVHILYEQGETVLRIIKE